MYYCTDCGEYFEEPVVWYDDPSPSGIALPPGYYRYEDCPNCGSDCIEECFDDEE